jgi:hypothetical protein
MEDVTGEKLDRLAHIFTKKRAILEAIILNPTAKDDTIKFLAATSDSSQLELILIDRIRLQRVPSIYDDMLANPRLTTALKHQVDREKGGGISMYDPQGTPREVPKLLLTGKVEDKIDSLIAETERIASGEGKKESVYKKVMTMTIPEKIQFALKGPKEGRALLIRDANKVVSASVLKSPKVNDTDIENFSKLRNVSEEILRGISMNRQWMRKMGIVDALAKNPKTPVPVAMKLLPRLNKFSLKAIANSRDVSAPVSKLATKLYKKGKS